MRTPQAPSLTLVVFKTADYMPELVEFNALTNSKDFGEMLIASVRAWADGRFNLGDTPEAMDTGKDTEQLAAVFEFAGNLQGCATADDPSIWVEHERKPHCRLCQHACWLPTYAHLQGFYHRVHQQGELSALAHTQRGTGQPLCQAQCFKTRRMFRHRRYG